MFNHSRSITINGGTINFSSSNSTSASADAGPLQSLIDECALGALLDSNERFDPPKVAEDTRQRILKDLMDWIRGGPGDTFSMTWLYGPAGAGKSAIAQKIAELAKEEDLLAGCFFFSRTASQQRSDGNCVVPTIVLQLLMVFPELRPFVEASLRHDPTILSSSRLTQSERLIMTPMKKLAGQWDQDRKSIRRRFLKLLKPDASVSTTRPRLIVIDGLDECSNNHTQLDLLQVLANAFSGIPLPFRLLVASRPESHIITTLEQWRTPLTLDRVRRINLDDDGDAEDDIRKFATQKFAEIKTTHPQRAQLNPLWPLASEIDALVAKSSSQFIFIDTALKYIQHPRGMPDERLEVVLGLSKAHTRDKPFATLDDLYSFLLRLTDEEDRQILNHLFGLMLLNTHDMRITTGWSVNVECLEEMLELRSGRLSILLDPILSLVYIPAHRRDPIRLYHASFFDYLRDESRSDDFHLDLSLAHETIASYWIRTHQSADPERHRAHYRRPIECCATFLSASLNARWSQTLRSYFETFPFLYQTVLLQEWSQEVVCIIHQFLDLLIQQDFGTDSSRLHNQHALRIGMVLAPQPESETGSYQQLFKTQFEQERHELYFLLSENTGIPQPTSSLSAHALRYSEYSDLSRLRPDGSRSWQIHWARWQWEAGLHGALAKLIQSGAVEDVEELLGEVHRWFHLERLNLPDSELSRVTKHIFTKRLESVRQQASERATAVSKGGPVTPRTVTGGR